MICYIKDKRTFITKKTLNVSEHDVVLKSVFNDKSKITVMGTGIVKGDYIYFKKNDDKYLGIIQEVKPDKYGKKTDLVCVEIENMFDREMDWVSDYITLSTENAIYTYMQYIKTATMVIGSTGITEDPILKRPFLMPHELSFTPYIIPETEHSTFNLMDFIHQARTTSNVLVDFEISEKSGADVLNANIQYQARGTHKIDFNEKEYTLISENYSDDTLSRVDTLDYSDEPNLIHYLWYLKKNGEVTDVEPSEADRVDGKHKTIFMSGTYSEEFRQKAVEEFTKNQYSHSIEFSSARRLNFYNLAEMRLNGQVLNSYISSVRISSETNQYIYKTGDMRTNIFSKIKMFFLQ